VNEIGPTAITILTSIVGLAMLAVIVSRRAQTGQVIQAGGTALSNVIAAAVAPLSGGSNYGATNFGSAASVVGGLMQ
jgi:hypothetical protein